jgi:hypothetical protein
VAFVSLSRPRRQSVQYTVHCSLGRRTLGDSVRDSILPFDLLPQIIDAFGEKGVRCCLRLSRAQEMASSDG